MPGARPITLLVGFVRKFPCFFYEKGTMAESDFVILYSLSCHVATGLWTRRTIIAKSSCDGVTHMTQNNRIFFSEIFATLAKSKNVVPEKLQSSL